MTNGEKGLKLLAEAAEIFKGDLEGAYARGNFSLAVRRAQEVVELSLKGALQILGVDYPKVHDVGGLLVQQAGMKKCPVEAETLKKMAGASLWLAAQRNLPFYGEGEYSEKEAKQAVEDARFVLHAVEDHFKT